MSTIPERFWVVIPAAGVGHRMGSKKPKQFLTLNHKTVIEWAIGPFLSHSEIAGIVIACDLNSSFIRDLKSRLSEQPEAAKLHWVEGGAERSDSVLNGLEYINQCNEHDVWTLVHDAARPCLTSSDLDKLIEWGKRHYLAAILAAPLVDTLKEKRSCELDTSTQQPIFKSSKTYDRNTFARALTPQMAPLSQLKPALEKVNAQQIAVTDDAQALEFSGFEVALIMGRNDNIKITFEEDLALAEWYLSRQENERKKSL